MSTYTHPRAFIDDVYDLLRANNYDGAIELIEAHSDINFDELQHHDYVLWTYNRICIYARFGDVDTALSQFQEAIDSGLWYSPSQLAGDEDLKPLADNPQFEALCGISTARYQKAVAAPHPELAIYEPPHTTDSLSLMIALHGNISSAAMICDDWKVAADYGQLLALPTSTQLFIEGVYLWGDFDKAELEIKQHYETVNTQYNIDPTQTIVGGHITGGNLAAWLAINQVFPIRGFIAAGLYITDLDPWIEQLDALNNPDVRGYVLIIEEDTAAFGNASKFVEALRERGFPCEFDVRSGLGHDDLPDDFAETLKRAINFVR